MKCLLKFVSFLGQQNSDIELVLHDKLISKEAAKMLNTRINRHAEVRQMKLLYVYSPRVPSPNSIVSKKKTLGILSYDMCTPMNS